MALLDRFRAQPRQKHADPAVRLGFVQEIPLEERELLAEIAREDADPRVRRAAVAKLMDPAALAGVAKSDADEAVREQAIDMLRDIALEGFEGIGEAESLAAVEALARVSDAKTLAVVAKTAPRAATAERALANVTDSHALGAIARHSEHELVRTAAFDALRDTAEILSVAINSEFKDPTLAAVERTTDRAELEQIAARAKNKTAAKRARTILREMDEAIAREAAAEKDAEAAAIAAAAAARAAEQDAAAREQAAREAAERHAADEAVRAVEAEQNRAKEETEALRRREQAAAERARREADEEAARKETERRRARQTELADEAAKIAEVEDLAAARRQFTLIRREWSAMGHADSTDPGVAARYAEADAKFAAKDAAAHEDDQRQRREALARLQQLVVRLEPLAARSDLTLKAGERALKDLRIALGTIPQLPSKRDYEEIVRHLKAAQTMLTPKVQELRDIAGWQRWANIGIQEQLCEKMEALKALEDPEEIGRQVRDLQQRWRDAADVPRAQGEVLWRRFKAAHDEVWAKCEAYFAGQAKARAANLAKKTALSERAEALAESTSWIQTADEIKKLQAEWKTIGPVTRGQEKAVWERFRAACDRFFSRRHADLAQRKAAWAENLAKKEALCLKAEALVESTDWEPAAAELRRLQAEWKTIGPVKKTRSEAIWQRFRGACDRFFARYAQRHDVAREERVAAREALVVELEGLASTDTVPDDLLANVRALRAKMQQEIAARGVDRERAAAIDDRFAAAFKAVVTRWPEPFAGTDLDPDANRKRMETLVQHVEELAKSIGSPVGAARDEAAVSPTTRLAAMLKDALAANTIGGKVDDDARLRAAAEDVRQAQANWSRIGFVPEETRRALSDRFARAIRAVSERAGQVGRPGGSSGSGGSGRSGEASRPGR
jgi:Domain of Unknown Function (DUF349)